MLTKMLRIGMAATMVLAALMVLAQPPTGGGGGGGGMRGGMMGGGGNNPLQLVGRKDVQTDLKITAEQKTAIDALAAKSREDMQAMRDNAQAGGGDFRATMEKVNAENAKKVDAILTEPQRIRLKEIRIQLDGNRAILNPDVQKEIGITADQKLKIDAAQKARDDKRQQMMEDMRNGGMEREAMQAASQKMTADFVAELGKIVTSEQAAKLKTMGGKPFVQEPRAGGG